MNSFIFLSLGRSGSVWLWGNLAKHVPVTKQNLAHTDLIVKVKEGKNIGFRFEIPFYKRFGRGRILKKFEDYENANPGIKKILSIRTPYNYMARMYHYMNKRRDKHKVPIFKENWKQCAKLVLDEPKTYYTILYDKIVLDDNYKLEIVKTIFNYEGEIKFGNWKNSERDNSSFLERWKRYKDDEFFRNEILEDQELKNLCKDIYDEEILASLPID